MYLSVLGATRQPLIFGDCKWSCWLWQPKNLFAWWCTDVSPQSQAQLQSYPCTWCQQHLGLLGDPNPSGSVLAPTSEVLLQFLPAGKLQVKFVNCCSRGMLMACCPHQGNWAHCGSSWAVFEAFPCWLDHPFPSLPCLFCSPGWGASVSPGPPAPHTPCWQPVLKNPRNTTDFSQQYLVFARQAQSVHLSAEESEDHFVWRTVTQRCGRHVQFLQLAKTRKKSHCKAVLHLINNLCKLHSCVVWYIILSSNDVFKKLPRGSDFPFNRELKNVSGILLCSGESIFLSHTVQFIFPKAVC